MDASLTNRTSGFADEERRFAVAITAYLEVVDWTGWPQSALLVPASYLKPLAERGAAPTVLPVGIGHGAAAAMVERLDGLVLIGGDDVCGATCGDPSQRTSTASAGIGRSATRMKSTPSGGRSSSASPCSASAVACRS